MHADNKPRQAGSVRNERARSVSPVVVAAVLGHLHTVAIPTSFNSARGCDRLTGIRLPDGQRGYSCGLLVRDLDAELTVIRKRHSCRPGCQEKLRASLKQKPAPMCSVRSPHVRRMCIFLAAILVAPAC